MGLGAALFILGATFATSAVSGVFGMAGGLMLMGALALVLPVSAAFVAHGFIQLVANGWRAVLHRRHVRWPIVGLFAAGSAAAAVAMLFVSYTPSKPALYLMLGLVPALLWLPKTSLRLDAARAPQALACGLLVTGLNLLAGVAGPLLDIFFVRTALTRHQIVATKAATQVFSHLAKIVVYGAPLLGAGSAGAHFFWPLLLCMPLAMAGTAAGGRVLDRMTDQGFLAWTRYIVTGIGGVYLVQGAMLIVRAS